jgi:AAA family ATP:ADP antiporter
LTEHGVEKLPYVYILIAFIAIVVNMAIGYISEKRSLIKVITITHLFNIIGFIGMFYLISYNKLTGWINTGALVYVSIYALVITSQFWLMINEILNIRDAKRLIGLIGAGAIAGGIFGGYMTSALVNHVGNSGMIIIVVGFLIFNLYISLHLNKRYRTVDLSNDARSEVANHGKIWNLLERPHVRNIAMVIGLGVVVSRLVDFHFNCIILEVPRSSEELTSFLGFWFSTINVAGFLIQLVLTSNIISRFGMEKSMYILPAGTLSMVLLALIFPGLTTAILLKSNDGALKQSIYKSSYELSLMPIHDTIKGKVKYLIDIVIDSLATGISGIILFLLMATDAIPIKLIILINIILCLVWIYFVRKAGSTFHQTFIHNIKKIAPDGSIIEEKEELNFITDDINEFKRLLKNSSEFTRQKILENFSNRIRNRKYNELRQLANDESDLVSIAAYKVGLEMGFSYVKLAKKYQRSTLNQKLNILEAVSAFLPDNKELKQQFDFQVKVRELFNDMLSNETPFSVKDHYRIMKVITLSKSYLLYSFIRKRLNNDISVEIKKAAIRACAFGSAQSFGKDLIPLVKDPIFEETVKTTLATYKLGYIRFFRKHILSNVKIDERLILILSRIDAQESIDTLFTLVDQRSSRKRSTALKALNIMRERNPNLIYKKIVVREKLNEEISILKKLYQTYFTLIYTLKSEENIHIHKILNTNRVYIDNTILRIFIFLGLTYNKKNIDRIYRAFLSKDQQNKSYALDFLDDVLNYELKRKLIPALSINIYNEDPRADLKKIRLSINPWRITKVFTFFYQFKDDGLNSKIENYVHSTGNLGLEKWLKSKKNNSNPIFLLNKSYLKDLISP